VDKWFHKIWGPEKYQVAKGRSQMAKDLLRFPRSVNFELLVGRILLANSMINAIND